VGEDVENIIVQLYAETPTNDVEAAQRGIVYIDEIDNNQPQERTTPPSPVTSPARV